MLSKAAAATSKKIRSLNQAGMALVTVIIFSAVAMIVITAGITLTTTVTQSNQQFLQGQQALAIAESGAENALLRLLRDPHYQQETLTLDSGTARIEVTGDLVNRQIDVTGGYKSAIRKVRVQTSFENGVLIINSWKEIF